MGANLRTKPILKEIVCRKTNSLSTFGRPNHEAKNRLRTGQGSRTPQPGPDRRHSWRQTVVSLKNVSPMPQAGSGDSPQSFVPIEKGAGQVLPLRICLMKRILSTDNKNRKHRLGPVWLTPVRNYAEIGAHLCTDPPLGERVWRN